MNLAPGMHRLGERAQVEPDHRALQPAPGIGFGPRRRDRQRRAEVMPRPARFPCGPRRWTPTGPPGHQAGQRAGQGDDLQVHCQPPMRWASQATAGGATNCPNEEACCIMPTVVETVDGPGGAVRTAEHEQRGRHDAPAEREHADGQVAQGRRQAPGGLGALTRAKAATLASATAGRRPQRNSRTGGSPCWSSRPPTTPPMMLRAAASAVSAAFQPAGTPAST